MASADSADIAEASADAADMIEASADSADMADGAGVEHAASTPAEAEPAETDPGDTELLPTDLEAEPETQDPSAADASPDVSLPVLPSADPVPFTCSSNAPGYLFQGNPTDIYEIDLVTGTWTQTGDGVWPSNVNGVGFNVLDNFIYGSTWTAPHQIVRVGSDGSVVPLGRPAGVLATGFHIGDVDENGHYWVTNGEVWFQVDLRPGSPTYFTVLASGDVGGDQIGSSIFLDWSYVPGHGDYLYTVTSDQDLYRFNRTTHLFERLGPVAGLPDGLGFGATYADADGFLYGSDNTTGRIFRIDVSTRTGAEFAQGPSAGSNDGARCALSAIAIDFGDAPDSYGTTLAADGPRHRITNYDSIAHTSDLMLGAGVDRETDGLPSDGADGDDRDGIDDEDGVDSPIQVTMGDPVTVSVAATNTTPAAATLAGWIDLNGDGVFDNDTERVIVTVPANSGTGDYELTFPAVTTAADTYARFRLFPGQLDATEALPTGPAAGGEVEDHLVNVLKRDLALEKASDATAATRAGDTVTYTVTATNTGDSDYTAANPAVVLDDLAGVLDDGTYNGDAAATIEGHPVSRPTFQDPVLVWSGPLASGETVTLTYTVTLAAGGDGSVLNVAFAPGCDPAGPDCEPTTPTCQDGDPRCVTELFELPRLTIEKSVDQLTVGAVGQTLTYTVVATNVGPGVYGSDAPAHVVDDLSAVLDDAELDVTSIEADRGVAPTYAEPRITWSGVLDVGESMTLTYQVTYTGEGDGYLLNTAFGPEDPEDETPDCPNEGLIPCDGVEVLGPDLRDVKSVDPAKGSTVVAGDELTYTLTFLNDGPGAAIVDRVDDLTHLLDDAEVTTDPVVSSGSGLAVSAVVDGRFSITGELAAGASATVTYTVTVRADGERGDNVLGNFLLDEGELPPEVPTCEVDDEDCTVNYVGELVDSKSVDPAKGSTVVAGEELTYTLTFLNAGEGSVVVDRVDDLTHLLDDAEVTTDPVVSSGSGLAVSAVVDGRFSITGELAAGASATVTYTVTVRADGERGDSVLGNFLLDEGELPPEEPTCEVDDEDCTVNLVRQLSIEKSADTTELPRVGQTVSYTVIARNIGTGDYAEETPAHVIDDMTGVLDDADLVIDSIAADRGAAPVYSAPRLTWTGPLRVGEAVTITYDVTYTAAGDKELLNTAFGPLDPEDPTPTCPNEVGTPCDEVRIPGAGLEVFKSVDPASGSSVVAGQELTYTLTFDNDGQAAAIVDHVDYLSRVLDDATIVDGPTGQEPLTVDLDGDRMWIGGQVPAGATLTVTYTVQVKPDGQRGDNRLGNFVLGSEELPPSAETVCEPGSRTCTDNPIGEIEAGKSVNPASGTEVVEGEVLTYTLTFTNTGEGDALVEHVDWLADVLDDAELEDGPTTSDPALTAVWEGERIDVRGLLGPAQTATVTYTVKVGAWGDQGNHHLGNFLVPSGETPPETCVEDSTLCTENPVRPPKDDSTPPGPKDPAVPYLPVTGPGHIAATLTLAAILLLLGGWMVRRSRHGYAPGTSGTEL